MMSTALILDITVVVILIVSFCIGWRRGLISSLLQLLGFAISLIAAWIFSRSITTYVYERFVRDKIVDNVSNKLSSSVDGVVEATKGIFGKLADVGAAFFDYSTISEDKASELGEKIVDQTIASPVQAVLRAIIFIILFAIFMLIIKLLSRLFKGVNKLPVLGTVNKMGGGLIGIVEGLIMCYLVVVGVSIIITLSADKLLWLNSDIVDQSRLFSILFGYNPLKAILDSGIVS